MSLKVLFNTILSFFSVSFLFKLHMFLFPCLLKIFSAKFVYMFI